MTTYKKESRKATLLNLLNQFKAKLLDFRVYDWENDVPLNFDGHNTIDRNLTSIEKQIKKL